MAYAQTSVVTKSLTGSHFHTKVVITETGVTGATDEWSVDNMVMIGTLVKVKSVLTAGAGSATSVDPQVGDEAGLNNIFENTTASASTSQYLASTAGVFALSNGTLYGRSKANGTADTIVTTIWITEGGIR